ncbi:MAG: uroporphyrinogen III methyltransferase/synthase [Rhodothermales bacterium]|jgi:uroporphyrinogen III methyltransferase/synthase
MTFTAGTRSSRLALTQTRASLDRIESLLSATLEMVPMSSPGDHDRQTDLRVSDPDFFTRFLDDAVRDGRVDCAVHSAKDLPYPVAHGLDWFWLPWREDPRDCVILRPGEQLSDLPAQPKVGVSSDRREEYSLSHYPNCVMTPIRGNIELRIAQLDAGDVDILLMAGAALNRLGMQDRITDWIPLSELPAPDGQGYLAITFREGDARWQRIRSFFVHAVTFVGAGPGGPELCTQAGIKALQTCEVCLHDALSAPELLAQVSDSAEIVDVGKRAGRYTISREALDARIAEFARQGRRVVRLKGGDPGMFGRLPEETAALVAGHIPFRVIPGVSSLAAATTGTGMLLTRRGLSHGCSVLTPRLADSTRDAIAAEVRRDLALVFFMAVGRSAEIRSQLLSEGRPQTEPAAMIYDAGMPSQVIVRGTLADIATRVSEHQTSQPGLLVIGEITNSAHQYPFGDGALCGLRILLTCSAELMPAAIAEVEWLGGIPVPLPLIELTACDDALPQLLRMAEYDWITLTSPSAVRCLLALVRGHDLDLRDLPKIMVPGSGVLRVLREHGLRADLVPDSHFGGASMLDSAKSVVKSGERVLRLRSNLAPSTVADGLRALGCDVDDCVLYRNQAISQTALPQADVVFFASGSAVRAFASAFGRDALASHRLLVIGQPTATVLADYDLEPEVMAAEATVTSSIRTLAAHLVGQALLG